ncbi:cache domain-containing sensor histidine kinase [Paenibacillus sp. PL2-23]
MSDTLKEQTKLSASKTFDETVNQLGQLIESTTNTLNLMSLSIPVNDIMSKTRYSSISDQYSDYLTLSKYAGSLQQNLPFSRIRLYLSDHFEGTFDYTYTFQESALENEAWYIGMKKHPRNHTYWFNSEDGSHTGLSVARMIWNMNDLSKQVGIVRIDLAETAIWAAMGDQKSSELAYSYFLNTDGEAMIFSGQSQLSQEELMKMLQTSGVYEEWINYSHEGHDMLVRAARIEGTNWHYVSAIPVQSILDPIIKLRNRMGVLLLMVTVVGYMLALYASNLSTNRIYRLMRQMRKTKHGELGTLQDHYEQDEIGELIVNYNYMVNQIRSLGEEKFESGKALKQAELRALQAQINPHFLYNSLDAIAIMSVMKQAPEITRMAKALTTFYKLSLNKGRDLVTLRDEIEHIKSYIVIQNIRFDDRIQLETAIQADAELALIPKLTLQPLVENAIVHGLFEKESKGGVISIQASLVQDLITISVVDNGVGFPVNPLVKGQGVGMMNVHERIQLTYGEAYGLSIRSGMPHGAAIDIAIPYVKAEEED